MNNAGYKIGKIDTIFFLKNPGNYGNPNKILVQDKKKTPYVFIHTEEFSKLLCFMTQTFTNQTNRLRLLQNNDSW